MGSVKLTTGVVAEAASDIVKLSKASPVGPQFVVHLSSSPLQELRARIAATATKRRVFLEFI
jgi:hypothetical protein